MLYKTALSGVDEVQLNSYILLSIIETAQLTIEINRKLIIPAREVSFTFSRSSGPGGQNVNKLNSRVTLWFDLEGSPSLTDWQKTRIKRKLGNRINNDGKLQVTANEQRSQHGNRQLAINRFGALLAAALLERPPRKKTRVSRAAREKRLRRKKQRGLLKKSRSGSF